MKSPRFVRPHSIVVKNYIGEVDREAKYKEMKVDFVKVNINYGIQQSQKGVTTNNKVSITIDMNDYEAVEPYVKPIEFKGVGFTLRADKDFIIYDGKEYTINEIKVINPFEDAPVFIEVYCR